MDIFKFKLDLKDNINFDFQNVTFVYVFQNFKNDMFRKNNLRKKSEYKIYFSMAYLYLCKTIYINNKKFVCKCVLYGRERCVNKTLGHYPYNNKSQNISIIDILSIVSQRLYSACFS